MRFETVYLIIEKEIWKDFSNKEEHTLKKEFDKKDKLFSGISFESNGIIAIRFEGYAKSINKILFPLVLYCDDHKKYLVLDRCEFGGCTYGIHYSGNGSTEILK